MITDALLPPPLIHELRARSFPRLFRITGSPGNRGFGRYLRQQIKALVALEKTPVEKAITLAYLGSFLVDHLVHAERTASLIIEKRELTEVEEKDLWDQHYGTVIPTLIREQSAEGEQLLQTIQGLARFTQLPATVDRIRKKRWTMLAEILKKDIEDESITEITILKKVQFILSGPKTPKAKALSICLAASLLADKTCWFRHIPWPSAYMHTMTDLYPFISQQPDVLEQIVCLA